MKLAALIPTGRAPGLAAAALALALHATAAAHTPLPTGNGFGLAVVAPDSGAVVHFYAHPYRFEKPDPKDALGEGLETTDFLSSLAWVGDARTPPAVGYAQESHVISLRRGSDTLSVFMPFGLDASALVLAGSSPSPLVPTWRHPPAAVRVARDSATRYAALSFGGVRETLLAIPLDQESAALDQAATRLAGSAGWVLLAVDGDAGIPAAVRAFERWRGTLAPPALVARELADLEAWRVKPPVQFASDAERGLWRQSEVVLRMAQSREPNRPDRWNHGLIVASLGDWFVPWVRDMAYATVALCRMGHRDEARAAVEAYFNARPVGKLSADVRGFPYQVSAVRYFGDGSEEPFFTMEGSTNVELDNWGLVLWVLGEYARRWGDDAWLRAPRDHRGSIYASARDFIVEPLLGNLDPCGDGRIVAADTSIWEERQKDRKHFAFSTVAAIAGLREFALLADRAGDAATATRVRRELAQLETGFVHAFASTGRVRGTLEPGEKNDVDGAALAAVNFRVVTDPAVIRGTVAAMDALKVPSGGWKRVRCQLTDPAIFEYWYERQEFVFVDLSLAEVQLRLGRPAEAAAIADRVVQKAAADNFLVPEMYVSVDCTLFHGDLGDPTGANPMVGYGAGASVLLLLEREALGRTPPAAR